MPLTGHRQRLARAVDTSIAATMTATVRITDDPAPPPQGSSTPPRSSSQWSKTAAPAPAPGSTPAPAPAQARVVYEGPARLQALPSAALNADVAGQDVSTRQVLVQLPLRTPDGAELPRFAAGRTAGHLVHVLAEPNDPAIVGAQLRVVDVSFASQRLTRDLTCSYPFNINNPRGTT